MLSICLDGGRHFEIIKRKISFLLFKLCHFPNHFIDALNVKRTMSMELIALRCLK